MVEYLELHREGYVEFATACPLAPDEDPNSIPSISVLGLVFSFVHLYRRLLERLGVSTPVVVALTILNVRDFYLAVPSKIRFGPGLRASRWRRDNIEVPLVYAQDLHAEADDDVRRLNDRLWNAFGYDHCWALKEDGTLILG